MFGNIRLNCEKWVIKIEVSNYTQLWCNFSFHWRKNAKPLFVLLHTVLRRVILRWKIGRQEGGRWYCSWVQSTSMHTKNQVQFAIPIPTKKGFKNELVIHWSTFRWSHYFLVWSTGRAARGRVRALGQPWPVGLFGSSYIGPSLLVFVAWKGETEGHICHFTLSMYGRLHLSFSFVYIGMEGQNERSHLLT